MLLFYLKQTYYLFLNSFYNTFIKLSLAFFINSRFNYFLLLFSNSFKIILMILIESISFYSLNYQIFNF